MRRVPGTVALEVKYSAALAIALDRSTPAEARELAEMRMHELALVVRNPGRARRDRGALGELICEAIEHRVFGSE